MKVFEYLKKKLNRKPEVKDKKIDKKKVGNEIPKEILDKLPPGVKIKRIVIGPKQIIKTIISIVIFFWLLSLLGGLLTPQNLSSVPISTLIESVKKGEVEKIVVSDDNVVANLKDGKIMDTLVGEKIKEEEIMFLATGVREGVKEV